MAAPSPTVVLQRLDALCTRLVTLSEQISADFTSFMEHVRTADQLYKALQHEATQDRVKASDLMRVAEQIGSAQRAVRDMVAAVAQASVGPNL